jgi:hypothetical protein
MRYSTTWTKSMRIGTVTLRGAGFGMDPVDLMARAL